MPNRQPSITAGGFPPGPVRQSKVIAMNRLLEIDVPNRCITVEAGVANLDVGKMQLVRCAFDPRNICNPGKVFPTQRLCGEVPGPDRRHPAEAAGLAERI